MAKPDILIIKPGSQRQIYGDLSGFKFTAIEPPLWAAIIAGQLRGLGYGVEVLDAEVENLTYEQTAQRSVDLGARLTVLMVSGSNPSASTMNMTGAGVITDHIRQLAPAMKTAFAGLHPSALPHRTMDEEAADFVIQGEGFHTFPALLDALRAGGDVDRVPGLWHRKEGAVVAATFPPLLEDLNSIPRPAWDMFPMREYRAHNWHCFGHIEERQPYAVLYTSLGCPFKCTFCCINSLFGKHTIRYRDPQVVIDEIDFLVNEYGVQNIKLIDEMFAINEKRVASICDPIIERGYNLNIWAYARVNTVAPAMLEKMKAAGINWLAYGFESGSKRVIADVVKGYRCDQVMSVVEQTKANDIAICSNFIFGLPEDDYDSMNDTLVLMTAINAEWANIYCAMAYPGSKLYDMAVEEGWPLPASWQAYSQYAHNSRPMPTRYLTSGQVLAFRDYAFDVYYKSPRYLNMIRKRYDEATMNHIIQMSAKTLARDNAEI
jgi:anaerobic magnesium-protoporphyrin IX monomethyl ester cyclase